jgi:predicted esterase
MEKITYVKLLNKTIDLYMNKGSLEAYNFISEYADKVDGNRAQIFNFRYALASASGLEKEALEIMKETVLDNGYWYEYDYLMDDDDLKPLYKFDEFQKLAKLCKEREADAKGTTESKLMVLKRENDDALLIALHGDQENIEIARTNWDTSVTNKMMLALPQSSQIQFSDGYVWEDVEKGSNELKVHYEKILEENKMDIERIIVGGFSAGARVALHAILNDKISVRGFIFVAPWLPEIEEWAGLIDKLAEKGVKGYVICGDQDDDCYECTQKFVALLEEKKIRHTYKLVEALDHDFPDNFEQLLKEAIAYINTTN